MVVELTDKTLYEKTNEVKDFKKCMEKGLAVRDWIKDQDKAIAVSFNQLGFTERCFVLKSKEFFGITTDIVINPAFKPDKKAKLIENVEMCLSFPDQEFKLKRWNKIKVAFYNPISEKEV
jgi:peptide deformylase